MDKAAKADAQKNEIKYIGWQIIFLQRHKKTNLRYTNVLEDAKGNWILHANHNWTPVGKCADTHNTKQPRRVTNAATADSQQWKDCTAHVR